MVAFKDLKNIQRVSTYQVNGYNHLFLRLSINQFGEGLVKTLYVTIESEQPDIYKSRNIRIGLLDDIEDEKDLSGRYDKILSTEEEVNRKEMRVGEYKRRREERREMRVGEEDKEIDRKQEKDKYEGRKEEKRDMRTEAEKWKKKKEANAKAWKNKVEERISKKRSQERRFKLLMKGLGEDI